MAWTSYLSAAVAFPFRLVWWPISAVINLILVLLSPFTLLVAYSIGVGHSIISLIRGLQPIYTFVVFGACVGVLAGLAVSCVSSGIFFFLGIYDAGSRSLPVTPVPSTPSERPGTGKTEDSSSYETEWIAMPKRRKRSTGIWSQTIHEEDDDDSDA